MRVSGPGEPAHLLLDVVDVLNELGITYALVGGLAVSYYGVPRYTDDADMAIWLKDTGKSIRDLTDHLLAVGYSAKLRRGDIDDPIFASILITDQHNNRVDLLFGIR